MLLKINVFLDPCSKERKYNGKSDNKAAQPIIALQCGSNKENSQNQSYVT